MDKKAVKKTLITIAIIAVLYLVSKIIKANVTIAFLKYHFTDLLFIPLQLTICLLMLRIIKRDSTLIVPVGLVATITCCMAVLFEWYLPIVKKNPNHTTDLFDVVMYGIGALLFIVLQKKSFSNRARC
ncbi:MAG: hypothetical protein M9916_09020 [Crocinitomicaceae bacterium]|nr:hypothetical protein [Crocinitomicaceae bacterium]